MIERVSIRELTAWPEGTLPAILEAFMWVEIIDPVTATDHDGQRIDVLRIVGPVKAPDGAAGLDAAKTGAQEIVARRSRRPTELDLGDGYEVIICDRHLAVLRAVPVASEVLWRYGQSHTADGELTWDARLSADASADYERDGG